MTQNRVLAAGLSQHVGEQVVVAGWLHRKRQLKSVTFLIVRDRTGLAQVVLTSHQAAAARAGDLPDETVIRVTGLVKANAQAPGGAEITDPSLTLVGEPAEPPPFDLYRPVVTAALPTVLDHSPTTLRHPVLRACLEISAASVAGFRATLDALDFTEIHTPKIVQSATESGANVFAIDYFGQQAEFGFITDDHDVMAMLREVIAGMTAAVRARAYDAVRRAAAKLPDVPAQIPELHFADAQELIAAQAGWDPRGEPDLSPADERWLGDWAVREHGSELLFVTGFPMAKRPFYTHPDPDKLAYSRSFDLLFRGMELVTGGQRLHNHADYLAALAARGEDPAPYAGYLQVFRHGMPPHGGFAIGLERWTARLTGAANIREVTLFPRDLHRLAP